MKILNLFLLLTLIISFGACKKPVPDVKFTYIVSSSDEGKVIFSNKSTNADRFEWDFGDGFTSSDKQTSHTYTKNGQYLVKLKATNSDAMSGNYSDLITISNVSGTYLFFINENFGEPVNVWVNGNFVGKITKYVIGQGYPACGQDGFITFKGSAGSYNWSAGTVSGSITWDGTFEITSGVCKKRLLFK